jgi:hypothetical protein
MGLFAFELARKRAAEKAALKPTLEQLKAIAKERGLKGYGNMKRETLLKKLEGD